MITNERYIKHRHLAKTVIDTDKLYDCFIKNYDDLLIKNEKFNLILNTVFCLESLKSQFCSSNVLAHLLFLIGLQIILTNVSNIVDIMFMMRLILFTR